MLQTLEATEGKLEFTYTHFMNKSAPVSKIQSLMDYSVSWILHARQNDNQMDIAQELEVVVPVMSLCPCSKEISDYGAHNQRSHVTVKVLIKPEASIVIEDLIKVVESQASCELWGLLKRTDEKYVTEKSYENPKFVEDLVRDVATQISLLPQVQAYTVEAENFESIHNHSAYALIQSN